MIRPAPDDRFNIWANSAHMRDLYRARARDEADEMTCAAQAADMVGALASPGDSLLDAGCGSGWFFHSLKRRGLDLDYWGVDRTQAFIDIARAELPAFGLPADRLIQGRIEEIEGAVDHVLCMNVLSNIANYHAALDRMLTVARKTVLLRESVGETPDYAYVEDKYLDPGIRLPVHVNRYGRAELAAFVEARGFSIAEHVDRRSGGAPELVIDHPHYWTFLVCTRTRQACP